MAKVNTSLNDERTIELVQRKGLLAGRYKWQILRLALARSLKMVTPPGEHYDFGTSDGKEYSLEQVCGEGKPDDENFTDLYRLLISNYHQQDLFADEEMFVRLLQRHIRRGLDEFRTSWRESHDFHEYLYQSLFSNLNTSKQQDKNAAPLPLLEMLEEIGVRGHIKETIDGSRLTRFMLHLPDANDLSKLKRNLDTLAFSLGLQEQGIFTHETNQPKVIGLDVPRPSSSWHSQGFHEQSRWIEQGKSTTFLLPVYPGVDVLGKPYSFDLAKAPHLLVAGTTGSGKSVLLHALIASLVQSCTPEQLQIYLIDPKRVEFTAYKQLAHLAPEGLVTDAPAALKLLKELAGEMERREQLLADAGVRDLEEGLKKQVIQLPFIVVFVEELSALLMESQDTETYLVRLAQKARATGIHLVLATQRPDADTFSGLLRSNVPSRIALTVRTAAESRIILDETGAEKLTGRGDMLIRLVGGNVLRLHGANIKADDIAQIVKITRK